MPAAQQVSLILSSLFFVFSPAWGQDSEETPAEVMLEDIVVTGTKTPRHTKDAPVKTEVISNEELKENHYTSVEQAIPSLPGVSIKPDLNRPGFSAVMQGLSEDHVLVLVDGIPQLQNSSGGFDLSQISTDNIERIEVVKGGSSALYGSQAMGGVINIITKSPNQKLIREINLQTGQCTGVLAGQGLPMSGSAALSGKVLDFGYRIFLSGRSHAAADRDPSTIAQDAAKQQKLNASLYLEKKWEDLAKVFARYQAFDESNEIVGSTPSPTFGTEARINRTFLKTQDFAIGAERNLNSENTLKGHILYEVADGKLELRDNPQTPFVESQEDAIYRQAHVETQWDRVLNDHNVLTTGLVYTSQYLDQKSTTTVSAGNPTEERQVGGRTQSSVAAFLQDDILFEKSELVPGFRIQNDTEFGTNFSPKVSYRYSPDWFENAQSNMRASVGTGYRTPNLKERFYILDHRSFGGYMVLGNDQLKPETSVSYQLGSEVVFDKTTTYYANLFLNQVKDLIEAELAPPDGSNFQLFKYQNITVVETKGIELKYATAFSERWGFDSTYTYSDAINKSTGKQLPLRPKSVARLALKHLLLDSKLSFLTIFNLRDREFIAADNLNESPGYTTLDAKLNYQQSLQSGEATYFLGVDNIFDVSRKPLTDDPAQVYDNRPAMGRFFYIGFKFRG